MIAGGCRLTLAALAALTLGCSRERPGASEETAAGAPEVPAEAAAGAGNRVRLGTSLGTITLELDPDRAPQSVENFRRYVAEGHYDGTVFHRVIDGFVIQGGGFVPDGEILSEKVTGAPIPNEARNGLANDRGTVAMARTADPDSATAQFFINVGNNIGLTRPNPDGHGYAVFGRVVEGMDVVDRIAGVPTTSMPLEMIHPGTGDRRVASNPDVPVTPVTIESAEVVATED